MTDHEYGPYVHTVGTDAETGEEVTETRCGREFEYCEPEGHGTTWCDQPEDHDGKCRNDDRELGTEEASHGEDRCPHLGAWS